MKVQDGKGGMLRFPMSSYLALLFGSIVLSACRVAADREPVAPKEEVISERSRNPPAWGQPLTKCASPAVDAICHQREDCELTWEQQLARFRESCSRQRPFKLVDDCDGYRIAIHATADTVDAYYYDRAGRLVTIYGAGMGGSSCYGVLPPISFARLEACPERSCSSL
jgi:hypothetical protein